jgi:hypothetical protein
MAMSRGTKIGIGVGVLLLGLVAIVIFAKSAGLSSDTIEKTEVEPAKVEDLLKDDRIEDKNPVFDPALIDSRPFGPKDNPWQLNLSAAVIRLDVPDLRDDRDAEGFFRLYPSYAAAAVALRNAGYDVLPSVNLIGGKAKQFDDGMYAAIDTWAVRNADEGVRSLERLIRQVMSELDPTGEPHAWLWASLEIGGLISPDEQSRRPAHAKRYMEDFLAMQERAEPVGFYTWTEDLKRAFQMLRYLQQPFRDRVGIPNAIARALRGWAEEYRRFLDLYSGLSNPFNALSFAALVDPANDGRPLSELAEQAGVGRTTVHFLPYSDSQEAALFERLYPQGIPPGADLMRDFIKAIRDGRVDLKPRPNAGWYDHQIYALETFLLPERGRENAKLLLTKKYKLRMLEAFKAAVTKTRETHIRQMEAAAGSAVPPSGEIKPRLRCEPNATYYLRMARSYTFARDLLSAHVPDLNTLNGYREGGQREYALGDELENMRLLFYGLYLVSCEDIGLEPALLDGELSNQEEVRALAANWLKNWQQDEDLGVDTRVAVPIYEVSGEYTRFWCTIGVRPMKLTAAYAKPPMWAPAEPGESSPGIKTNQPPDWEEVPGHQLQSETWILLTDEFAEAHRKGNQPLTRSELRDICNNNGDKQAILRALEH